MTQVFDERGEAVPVTVIEAGPCTVIRGAHARSATATRRSSSASATSKESRFTRPVLGHFKKRNLPPAAPPARVPRRRASRGYQVGQSLDVSIFEKGRRVDVQGMTKGRGFQGVVKRHGFIGRPRDARLHDAGKQPGSIGASAYPSRVIKGKRLPGHMGGAQSDHQEPEGRRRSTPEQNLLMVRGAVPGPANGLSWSCKKREG